MDKLNAKLLIQKIQETLIKNNFDYQEHINGLGQVCASEKRDKGKTFTINEHLKGLILAMLSSQKPWEVIANNINEIDQIFFNYDLDEILNKNGIYFEDKVTDISCGNISIKAQMESLNHNIEILKNIQNDHGSVDNYVVSETPDKIANEIGNLGGKYKLEQIGFPLALEYLKNVGIKAIKPDRHLRRIISRERLGFTVGKPKEAETFQLMNNMAKEIEINPTYFYNLLWLFCAKGYGEICGKNPKCGVCELKQYCNFPPKN